MHAKGITCVSAAILFIASCGDSSEPADPGPPQAGTVTIRVTSNLRFEPANVTVAPGTVVRWINDAAVFHTVTPDNSSQPGVWSRRSLNAAGDVFSHTFSQAGQTYTYFCEPHVNSGMRGTIQVSAAAN